MTDRDRHDLPTVRPLAGSRWRCDAAAAEPIERWAPEETPIGLSYDSEPYAVLMATPADVVDLALGFTLTERIASPEDVLDVRVSEQGGGLTADILLTKAGAARVLDRRRRTLEGRSSCGLCGLQNPQDALRDLPRLPPGLVVAPQAIQGALAALDRQQPLGAQTRATHAAAWASAEGEVLLIREDVGRHNALDKLIGAAGRAGLDPSAAFAVITSRCSYEMVEKAALAGLAMIVAISAPTALAVQKAEAADMTLVGLARHDGHTVFAGPDRIRDPLRPFAVA
ncbi:MAG TPA: formate dehydrogenase accessory sulfurtransferase FdhD [Caulobacteraceae bacterium]|nr:formate dehydrogenase accessory sulfurtransferase FdhD [Caulobacteraceae bacterium]